MSDTLIEELTKKNWVVQRGEYIWDLTDEGRENLIAWIVEYD